MKNDELVASFMVVFGTVAFWGLFGYRLYSDGYEWIYKTNDGIFVAGFIGLAGYVSTLLPSIQNKV